MSRKTDMPTVVSVAPFEDLAQTWETLVAGLRTAGLPATEGLLCAWATAQAQLREAIAAARQVPVAVPLEDAARLAGFTPEGLRYRCRQGTVPAVKTGRRWFVSSDWDQLRGRAA
jgi:hypothetical protein